MAAATQNHGNERWSNFGVETIPPDLGIQIMDLMMDFDDSQVAVLNVNWQKFLNRLPEENIPSLFVNIAKREMSTISETQKYASESRNLLRRMEKADPKDRDEILAEHIRRQIIVVLKLDPNIELPPDQGLSELGMDSLMAVELKNRLMKSLNCTLPATIAFDYPTIEALTEFLKKDVLGRGAADKNKSLRAKNQAELNRYNEMIEDIADEDLEKELNSELEKSGY
jgi:acyl carrier protein